MSNDVSKSNIDGEFVDVNIEDSVQAIMRDLVWVFRDERLKRRE